MQSPAVLLSKYSLRLNKCVGDEVGFVVGLEVGTEVVGLGVGTEVVGVEVGCEVGCEVGGKEPS